MTLYKLNTVTSILIEDDYNKNIIPLLLHFVHNKNDTIVNLICYDQPATVWKEVFKEIPIRCIEKFDLKKNYKSPNSRSIYIIDSITQMALDIGWCKSLNFLRELKDDSMIDKIITVLHKDCILLASKFRIHLNHIMDAVISFPDTDTAQLSIQIKKGGKLIKTKECLSYDTRCRLVKLTPEAKVNVKVDDPVKILPTELTTFKIETDQIQQIEKYNLKLPYMSKIKEGEGKVYYEPDAVDDWDEEDPDDDLDI